MADRSLIRLVQQIRGAPDEAQRSGGKLRDAVKTLARAGRAGLEAIVATDGQPTATGQHPRDVWEAIDAIYWEMGRLNPHALVEAFYQDKKTPRSSLVWAMQSAKPELVIDCLLKALVDADSWVRWCAVEALIAIKHPQSKPAIFRAILDRRSLTRHSIVAAVNTTDFFRDLAAIPFLRRLLQYRSLKRRNPGTWKNATQALERLERELARKPVLERSYAWSDITDRDLASLQGLTSLRSLDVSETRVSDKGLHSIRRWTQLQTLNISNTRITPQGLRTLQRLPRLRSLTLGGVHMNLSCGRLKLLTPLISLRELDLGGTSVRSDDLKYLAPLKNLRSLSLFYRIRDEGLAHLQPLTRLESLRLYDCPITDQGLAVLRRFKNLREFRLEHAPIGDEALNHLAAIPRLRRIILRGTEVTPRGLERFRKARPECKVET